MKKLSFAALLAVVLGACGGGSGVKGELVVAQLSPQDWSKYCNWFNGQIASVAGKSCGDMSLAPVIMLDCNKNPVQTTGCKATVSQAEQCTNKLKDTLCKGARAALASSDCVPIDQSCAALFANAAGL